MRKSESILEALLLLGVVIGGVIFATSLFQERVSKITKDSGEVFQKELRNSIN
ncbi:MAG: hypothetical protein QXZ20_03485 [Candidatus Aenigmatarchaeota archaeon]